MTRTYIRVIIDLERRDKMELVKSKGMVIFLVMFLSITIISSINTKKYEDKKDIMKKNYISMNAN